MKPTFPSRRTASTSRPPRIVLLGLAALAMTACDSERQVGSACPGGACETGAALQGTACLLGDTRAEIAITAPGSETPLDAVCLPRALPRSADGLVECDLVWHLPTDSGVTPSGCEEIAFARKLIEPDELGREQCAIDQVAVSDGELVPVDGQGWYYDDFSEGLEDCAGTARQRVALTPGALPTDGITMDLRCGTALAAADTPDGLPVPVEAEACTAPRNVASEVGAACTPSIQPELGFDDRESYVELGADGCQSSACLVFRVRGDISPDCDPEEAVCAHPDEIDDRVYCSCRCSAGDGEVKDLCECPSEYSCVDILDRGPADTRGGYCVLNGTFSQ